jgi:5-methylcytosine-specific restriction endonuclease McrA
MPITMSKRISDANQRHISKAKRYGVGHTVTTRHLAEVLDSTHCHYCGEYVYSDHRTVDHRIPFSRGGHHIKSNLIMACKPCNDLKTYYTEEEFLLIKTLTKGEAKKIRGRISRILQMKTWILKRCGCNYESS